MAGARSAHPKKKKLRDPAFKQGAHFYNGQSNSRGKRSNSKIGAAKISRNVWREVEALTR